MSQSGQTIHIVGAGLAGSECAYQLAEKGHRVVLHEMRSKTMTPAHKTSGFAELVCSNSFGSATNYSAPGQLKWEAEQLGSLNLDCAYRASIPAGMALGVDRHIFSDLVTEKIEAHPNIEVRKELINSLDEVPRPAVIATGPLTHEPLASDMQRHFREEGEKDFLYFYDAIAPIIDFESINFDIAWKANRFDDEGKDYINCPLSKEEYYDLISALKAAPKVDFKDFEKTPYFESCMPVEAIVERGDETLRFGPLSPKGLRDPRTGDRPYAVVQLRQDNLQGTAYNMVGFQTKMSYGAQKDVFRLIPGLEEAEFLKLGSIHRNLYIHSPKKLTEYLASRKDDDLFFAGQITGVEGYFESTCIGMLVASFIHDKYTTGEISYPPRASAFGSLLNAITEPKEQFQPTNINFGLLPKLLKEPKRTKGQKKKLVRRDTQLQIAKIAFTKWINGKTAEDYSTVTDFAKLRGWSTSRPSAEATW